MQIMSITESRLRVAYIDLAGSGTKATPCVFIHGLGSSAIATFTGIAARPELRQRRSILVDMPGFGYSAAPDDWTFSIEDQARALGVVLERLDLPPVHLVGHSMGGSIAIALAHAQPARVARLIVAEPNLDPGTGTLSGHITRMSEAVFVSRGYERMIRAMENQARRGDANAAIFAPTLRQASAIALHRAASSLRADRSPTFREQFLTARMPRLYIGGERSNKIPASELTSSGVAFVTIANAGHTMMDDDPAAFARAIDDRP
jgi:pimeloyl-ACP methyl ester carboxylesterase